MSERLREGEPKRDPLDDLIGILEADNPREDQNGLSVRAKLNAMNRLRLLQEMGEFPSEEHMDHWTPEHDEMLSNLVESVRSEFGIGIYAPDN
jgi:hypothetical protein